MNIMDELRRRHKIMCDHYGVERVVATFLYGSQNYKMDIETSDIDSITIIVPSLEDIIIMRQPINFYNTMETGEMMGHKDLRVFVSEIRRASALMMELLYTDYRVINPLYYPYISELILHREKIADSNKFQLLNAWVGQGDSFLDRIVKKDYRIKDITNLFRTVEFLQQYIVEGRRYGEALIPRDYELLRSMKRNCGDPKKLTGMIEQAKDSLDLIKNTYAKNLTNTKDESGFVQSIGIKIYKKYLERIDLK